YEFKSFDKPEKRDTISNIEKNNTLFKAFHFVPGQELHFKVKTENESEREIKWLVDTDIYNNSYLYEKSSNSLAYFKNEGNIHYFTHFEGNRKSLLFWFYLGAYKVPCGFYKNLQITDTYPIHLLNKRALIFLQDFIAPFYMFIKSEYEMEFTRLKDNLTDSTIQFISSSKVKLGNNISRELNFEFEIESNRIKKFVVIDENKTIEATEVSTENQ
ncbi:MAG: hypothetical protein KDC09_08620, partial [Bacteroidales bacterium]|nr:hypothetical protein [Bacteroidales bacterium]